MISRIKVFYVIHMKVCDVLFGIHRKLLLVLVCKSVICLLFVQEGTHPWLRICYFRQNAWVGTIFVLIKIGVGFFLLAS